MKRNNNNHWNYTRNTAFKSFIGGMGSIIDMTGTYFISRDHLSFHSTMESDNKALRGDWEAIGRDLRNVMRHELIK